MLSHPQVQFTNKGQAAFSPLQVCPFNNSWSPFPVLLRPCTQHNASPQHPSPPMQTCLLLWPGCFHVVGCTSGLEGGVAASSHFGFTRAAEGRLDASTLFLSHLFRPRQDVGEEVGGCAFWRLPSSIDTPWW